MIEHNCLSRKTVRRAWDYLRYRAGMASGCVYKGPEAIEVGITDRCALSCSGCVSKAKREHPRPDMTDDVFHDIVLQARSCGVRTVMLIGEGDPFLHPRIFDYIGLVKQYGMRCLAFTSGVTLDRHVLMRLSSLGLDTLKISMWETDLRRSLILRPAGEELFRKIDGLLRWRKESMPPAQPLVDILLVLHRKNFLHIREMNDYCLKRGVQKVRYKLWINPPGLAWSELCFNDDRSLQLLQREIARVVAPEGIVTNLPIVKRLLCLVSFKSTYHSQLPSCRIGWLHTVIETDGSVVFCCQKRTSIVGNVRKDHLWKIFSSPDYARLRKAAARNCKSGFCSELCLDFAYNFKYIAKRHYRRAAAKGN